MDQWWWDNTTWPRIYLYCHKFFRKDLSWSLSFNLGSWCRKWWVCLVDISLVEGLNNVPLAICFHDKHVSLQFRFQNKINLACFIAAEAEISLVSPHIELINMVANTKSFTSSLCLWSSWVVSLWDTRTLLAFLNPATPFSVRSDTNQPCAAHQWASWIPLQRKPQSLTGSTDTDMRDGS